MTSPKKSSQKWLWIFVPINAAIGGFSTLLPLYILDIGGTVIDVGNVVSAYSLALIPSSILWGMVLDRKEKRKPFVIYGYLGITVLLCHRVLPKKRRRTTATLRVLCWHLHRSKPSRQHSLDRVCAEEKTLDDVRKILSPDPARNSSWDNSWHLLDRLSATRSVLPSLCALFRHLGNPCCKIPCRTRFSV